MRSWTGILSVLSQVLGEPRPTRTRARGARGLGSQELFFFAHHKVGSSLLSRVSGYVCHYVECVSMRTVLCDEQCRRKTQGGGVGLNRSSSRCTPSRRGSTVTEYWDAAPGVVFQIANDCPNFRAVHVVRDPQESLLSAYSYYYSRHDAGFKARRPLGGMTPAHLRGLPPKDALATLAAAYLPVVREMYGVSLVVQSDPRVLSMRLRDWATNFTTCFRRVLDHFAVAPNKYVGTYPTNLEMIYDEVAAFWGLFEDVHMGGTRRHVSSRSTKIAGQEAYAELLREGDRSIVTIDALRHEMRDFVDRAAMTSEERPVTVRDIHQFRRQAAIHWQGLRVT